MFHLNLTSSLLMFRKNPEHISAFAVIKNTRNVFSSLFHNNVDLGHISKQNVKLTKKDKELIK